MASALYKEHFGLSDAPFSIAPDPHYLFLSRQHREALAHLLYGVGESGGFVLLTGDVGTGKTTVCRCLLQQLPDEVDIALVFNPRVNPEELLETICGEFHIDCAAGRSTKYYVDRLTEWLLENHAAGRRAVLLIDEAQNLSAPVLEQLRLLTNLETSEHKLLQLILLGQPELRDVLARPDMSQFAQRITARYHLGPLDLRETGEYVAHRLAVAGRVQEIFPTWAIRRVHRVSAGVPRLINIYCDRVLLGLYAERRFTPRPVHLRRAEQEVTGRLPRGLLRLSGSRIAVASALGTAAVLWFFAGLPDLPQVDVARERLAAAWQARLADFRPQPPAALALLDEQEPLLGELIATVVGAPDAHCEDLAGAGWRCLSVNAGPEGFASWARPGVARLRVGERSAWALVEAGPHGSLMLRRGARRLELGPDDVTDYWLGEVIVLSTFPHGGPDGLPAPGDRGDDVAWLRDSLDRYYNTPHSAVDVDVVLRDRRSDLALGPVSGPFDFLLTHYPEMTVHDNHDRFDAELYARLKRLRDELALPADPILDEGLILQLEAMSPEFRLRDG